MKENLEIDICEHGNERDSCELCKREKKEGGEYKPKSPRETMKCPHGEFYRDCTICSAIVDTEKSIEEEEARTGKSLTKSQTEGETANRDLEIPSLRGEELTPPSKSEKPKKKRKLFGAGTLLDPDRKDK